MSPDRTGGKVVGFTICAKQGRGKREGCALVEVGFPYSDCDWCRAEKQASTVHVSAARKARNIAPAAAPPQRTRDMASRLSRLSPSLNLHPRHIHTLSR